MMHDYAVVDLQNERLGGGGNFIQTVRAVHYETALQSERGQSLGHEFRGVCRWGADELRRGSGRIGERTEKIECRAHVDLQPRRLRVFHGWMHGGREQETDADVANRL